MLKLTLGGRDYTLSPLCMRDLAEVSAIYRRLRPTPIDNVAERFAALKQLDEAAAREWLLEVYRDAVHQPAPTTAEVCTWMATVDGLPWLLWVLALRHDPSATVEAIRDAILPLSLDGFIALSNEITPLLGAAGGVAHG